MIPSRNRRMLDAAELRLAVTRLARRVRQQGVADASPSMLSALASIERLGPVTLGELAAAERVRPPSMTRVVASLEERGLVSRQADDRDRRVARVRLTPEGEGFLGRSRTQRDAWLVQRLGTLTRDDLRTLRDALPVLVKLAGEAPAAQADRRRRRRTPAAP